MKKVLAFRHVPYEGLGTIEVFLNQSQFSIEYRDLFSKHPVPENPKDFDFIISMGGPMNVDETAKFPFLLKEREFLKKTIDAEIPVLGICLGAQMIARALGARVYPGKQKEIGWYPIQFTKEAKKDPVFQETSDSFFFHWHGDTFDLPKGAALLASSELFKHQAFRYGRHVYALQFHIEVTKAMIEEWIREGKAELASLPQISESAILKETEKRINSLNQLAAKIYEPLFSLLSYKH